MRSLPISQPEVVELGLPVANTLDGLAEICAAKADHIRSSYDDRGLARLWDTMANILARAEERAQTYGL